jgi:hypothetical protein
MARLRPAPDGFGKTKVLPYWFLGKTKVLPYQLWGKRVGL